MSDPLPDPNQNDPGERMLDKPQKPAEKPQENPTPRRDEGAGHTREPGNDQA